MEGEIHVIGVGLDGVDGLSGSVQQIVEQATLLVGSVRHLSYFPTHPARRLMLEDLGTAIAQIRSFLLAPGAQSLIVILTSGDPLFFGLGRLLLHEFPVEQLTFHPHISSIQLAFSRVKLAWQDAKIVSVHGRSLDQLIQTLQQGAETIAVLTDNTNTPSAIVRLLRSLDLPSRYQLWVCENLGGLDERITSAVDLAAIAESTFDPLNVVILQRIETASPTDVHSQPLLGIPDSMFLSFSDRPGLMTKREVRVLVLSELALQPNQTVWDVGAGTGSVSIELARLCPNSTIYAIEKTATGFNLLQQNCQRFQVKTVHPVHGAAPAVLANLPQPDRVFIGGSGGYLSQILDACATALNPTGRIVLALATVEHLNTALTWLAAQPATSRHWHHHLLQINVSRSVAIASLTRFAPLNPVMLLILEKTD